MEGAQKRYFCLGMLMLVTLLSGAILSSSSSSADANDQADATVTVASACTMFRESTVPHVATGFAGNYYQDIGTTRLNTMCNDKDGYAIYAIGYSNDTDGDTNMYGEEHNETIPTGTETGDVSNWSMKLTKDLESYNPENLTIISPYNNYAAVPSTQTKVAAFTGATDTTKGSVVETTYAVRVSPTQLADTYVGQVKYTMVHPGDGAGPGRLYIQDVTKSTCPTTTTVAYDKRDEQPYTIKKFGDDCWMTENLNLAGGTLLTPELSNVTSNYTLPASTTDSDAFRYYAREDVFNSGNKDCTNNQPCYSYYSLKAALAGELESGEASTQDICPAGWQIPDYEKANQFRYDYVYSISALIMAEWNPVRSGYIYRSAAYNTDGFAYYWTSTNQGTQNAYRLRFMGYNDNWSDIAVMSDVNSDGLAVRCVAKYEPEPQPDVQYLQDVANWKDDLAVNESMKVSDARDGKTYWVTKLETSSDIPDGRADCTGEGANRVCTQIWMTQNLDLDLSMQKTLTHYDTDLGWTTNDPSVTLTPQAATSDEVISFAGQYSGHRSYDPGDRYYYTSGEATNDIVYQSLHDCVSAGHTEDDCRHYHSGNIYNNYIARAANATSTNNPLYSSSTVRESDRYLRHNDSICPAGWKLPEDSTSTYGYSDYTYLLVEKGVAEFNVEATAIHYATNGLVSLRAAPLWFNRVGIISSGSLYHQTVQGGYWTNGASADSAASNYKPDLLYITSDYIRITGNDDSNGLSIRCVARPDATAMDPSIIPEPDPYEDMQSIQDITIDNCPTSPLDVYDTRDGEVYTVQKLADGNCWMLENLRLGRRSLKVLTPEDTNIDTEFTLPAGSYVGFNSFTLAQINIESKNDITTYGNGEEKIGVYYNYCAATAGTYCYENGEATGDATNDICPKGWRLPTGGESGEYQALLDDYGNSIDFKNSLRTTLAGYFFESTNRHQGKYGSYWTSTKTADDYIYSLDVRKDSVEDDWASSRNVGLSVRCVAKEPAPEPPHYLQDVTIANCPTTPTVLYDSRDEEAYTVQKLADGKCWLLDNLRIDLVNVTLGTLEGKTNASDRTLEYLKGQRTGSTQDQYPTSGVATWTSGYQYNKPLVRTANINDTYSYGDGEGKAGALYNFCAASAGSFCFNNGYSYGNIEEDICPKGWRLPTSGSGGGELRALFNAYNSDVVAFENAFRTVPAGSTSGGSVSMAGSVFWMWSKNRNDNDYSYAMSARTADPLTVNPASSYSARYNGYSIRCVVKDPEPEVPQYIQDVTNYNCPRNPITVIDKRDNESYTIQKLADDNCWMLENLRTDLVSIPLATLKGNTNASDTTLEYLKGTRIGTVSDQYPTSAVSNWTSGGSYSDPLQYTTDKNMLYSWGNDFGKAGVYYNVCAASAGSNCYGNGQTYSTADVDPITEDICPKGWHIPTGDASGEFQTLYSIYHLNTAFRSATQLPFAGMYYDGTVNNAGSSGYYFTSTTNTASGVYRAAVGLGTPSFGAVSNTNGNNVRCIVNH